MTLVFAFGIALLVLGGLLWLLSPSFDGVDRAIVGSVAALFVAAGGLLLAVAFHRRERERVDELWREFDAHVRTCPCMTREWTPEVEAEAERNVERHEAQHAGGVR